MAGDEVRWCVRGRPSVCYVLVALGWFGCTPTVKQRCGGRGILQVLRAVTSGLVSFFGREPPACVTRRRTATRSRLSTSLP
jgi:hypothetical protein